MIEGHRMEEEEQEDKDFKIQVVMWADLKERQSFTFFICLFHRIFREAIVEFEFRL